MTTHAGIGYALRIDGGTDMIAIDTIEEVRKTRREISRQCDFDPRKLVNYYLKKQRERKRQQDKKRKSIAGNC